MKNHMDDAKPLAIVCRRADLLLYVLTKRKISLRIVYLKDNRNLLIGIFRTHNIWVSHDQSTLSCLLITRKVKPCEMSWLGLKAKRFAQQFDQTSRITGPPLKRDPLYSLIGVEVVSQRTTQVVSVGARNQCDPHSVQSRFGRSR